MAVDAMAAAAAGSPVASSSSTSSTSSSSSSSSSSSASHRTLPALRITVDPPEAFDLREEDLGPKSRERVEVFVGHVHEKPHKKVAHGHHHHHHKQGDGEHDDCDGHEDADEEEEDEDADGTRAAVRKLQRACACSVVFMCVQFAGGYYAGSLAVMTDAAHLLADVAGFLVSLFAVYVGSLPATVRMPFGYHRAEVLGALISVLLIWMLTLGLVYAAVSRLIADIKHSDSVEPVNGKAMFIVSGFGLGINLLLMRILGHTHSHSHSHSHGHGHSHGHSHGHEEKASARSILEDGIQASPSMIISDSFLKTPMSAVALIDDAEGSTPRALHSPSILTEATAPGPSSTASVFENLNVQAAYIHALGDFLQSLGVCVAGALIWYNPAWQIADPLTTLIFSVLVLGTTVGVLTRSVAILMEAAPASVDLQRVERHVRALESVYDCHDLRVWALTEGNLAASVHVIPNGESLAALRDTQRLLRAVGVRHPTVQVEPLPGDSQWGFDDDESGKVMGGGCAGVTFDTDSPMMSVPRASCATSRAAEPVFTIE